MRLILLSAVFTASLLLSACSDILSLTTADPIVEDPGYRSTGRALDDEILETKALVNLDKVDPQLAQSHINVTAYNGVVLLSGQVSSEQQRQLATNTVAKLKTVRRIHNELTVSGKTSMVARSNDGWLTTKLKSKMLANSTIESDRIKVVTENGVVFLMGLVTQTEGKRAAQLARETGGVQKVVIIFEYI
jgi:osmotically-inducible protein OsmY